MHFGNPNALYIQPLTYVDEQNEQIIDKIHVDRSIKYTNEWTKLALFTNLAN